jgi:hypothetical protein
LVGFIAGKILLNGFVSASRYSRTNTQAGASSLVSSQALSSVSHEMAKGQDPLRKMDNGSPEVLK